MRRYNPKEIEPKWQKIWEDSKIYQATEDKSKPKRYVLEYFPYPSGANMHVGHVRNYTIGDALSRALRMQGNNVLHPMGWDAFGLPAENYAIKNNIPPRVSTDQNIKTFKRQLMQMGFSYDWSREIDSSKPEYYKWTQWLFLHFYKKGLAYRATSLQNWCPTDKTVLANEQVINKDGVNVCERDGTPVVQKELPQWFLKITDYADRLADDLDELDWPQHIKTMQRNWIGRSRGAVIEFEIENSKAKIQTFTTRPDTIFGATYLVLAPEHPLVSEMTTKEQTKEVQRYVAKTANKTELDRKEDEKIKTGVGTGAYAINPANSEKIPVWIADYVLMSYGTGAIMAVPAHDHRDGEFAGKHGLPVRKVIEGGELPYDGEGKVVNSGTYNDMESAAMREKIVENLTARGVAKETTTYRLRDWTVSRQRYWGCPIPIIYCDKDGIVPVPEEDLPVLLPENVEFKPTGQSPLQDLPEFVNVKCPKCGGDAKRETDTFDTFVDSSWYFLRFTDPHNDKEPFAKEKVDYWMPVDNYIGGAEHAVVHLLYARFWTKVLYNSGLVSVHEPFKALRNQGMIGGSDGRKMGKRYGNVVTPEELIKQGYGADALRLYELFIGPYNQGVDWNPRGIAGTFRFLQRVWTLLMEYQEAKPLSNKPLKDQQLEAATHRTIKKISADIEDFSFNTAIASLMELVNELYKIKAEDGFASVQGWKFTIETLIQLLAPFAPHIAEELWQEMGHESSVHIAPWPKWDESLVKEEIVTLAVQVNGKVRAEITLPADVDETRAIEASKTDEKVAKLLEGKTVKKAIYVPGRLVSLVTE